jgi:hypothetical protein
MLNWLISSKSVTGTHCTGGVVWTAVAWDILWLLFSVCHYGCYTMCVRRLASPVTYLVVTTPGRVGYYSGCSVQWSHTLAPWGGEAECSSLWLTGVYFTMIRFVLVNELRDSVVPICIRVVGMYMLVEAYNVYEICIVQKLCTTTMPLYSRERQPEPSVQEVGWASSSRPTGKIKKSRPTRVRIPALQSLGSISSDYDTPMPIYLN